MSYKILHIIPYSKLFPPRSGGALRCLYLLKELSSKHEVHAVILQPENELKGEIAGIAFPCEAHIYGPNQMPPPRTIFDILPRRLSGALKYRFLRRSFKGPSNSIVLQTYHIFKTILNKVNIDFVLYEHEFSTLLRPIISKIDENIIHILDAHNIDHQLMKLENTNTDTILNINYRRVSYFETHLAQTVDAYFACSDSDNSILQKLNRRELPGYTIPNGVDTKNKLFHFKHHNFDNYNILFCGNLDYKPNINGLLWFYNEILPLVRKKYNLVKLVIIGTGSKRPFNKMINDPSVNFIGAVNNVVPYYNFSIISVAPLQIGSGTRLKILEAMSLGTPVVSTTLGAEGIDVIQGKNIILADTPETFASGIFNLIENRKLTEILCIEARKLVENNYDWSIVGTSLHLALEELFHS